MVDTTYKMNAKTKTKIETERYKFNHGRAPRGQGSWAFAQDFNAPGDSKDILWVHNSSYGDARKAAIEHFSAKGVSYVHVLA